MPRVLPASWITDARDRLESGESPAAGGDRSGAGDEGGASDAQPLVRRLRSRRGWADASGYTISDLTMLRKELVVGFGVAGFLAALVPAAFWRSLFWTGHGFASSVENVVLGPFLAIVSFVCSVGNVPLAAALWQGGISFGGVVSFVFADLITLPLLSIYRKYYGTAITVRILLVFWAVMSTAGLAVEYLFRAVRVPEPARPVHIIHTGFGLNYTLFLNAAALIGFGIVYWLYRHRDTHSSRFSQDPVCGMQVETAQAPARRGQENSTVYFCSDHCAHRYDDHRRRSSSAGEAARS